MYNINTKKVLFSPCSIIGIVFLLVGAFIYTILSLIINNVSKYELLDNKTHGDLVSVHKDEDVYTPIYSYIVDDNYYECKNNFYTSNNNFPNTDIIYYNSNNPKDCYILNYSLKEIKILKYILIIPSIFILLGLIFIINSIIKYIKLKNLIVNGVLFRNLDCKVVNSKISVNGIRLPIIVIEFTCPDGVNRVFKSNIKSNNYKNIYNTTADLLVDINNYKNYYIDFNIER